MRNRSRLCFPVHFQGKGEIIMEMDDDLFFLEEEEEEEDAG